MIRYMKGTLLQATDSMFRMVADGHFSIAPKGRTFSVKYTLPRLPVPPLEQTLRKYLDSCRPLLNDEQYKATEEIVSRFLRKEGPILQELLEEKAGKEINWLSEWWKNWAYLDTRVPLVVNVSPGVCLPRQSYRGQEEQIEFAARFIAGILDYKMMLDEQKLPVDTLGGKPLCMSHYYQLFNAYRIPGVRRDSYVCIGPTDSSHIRHINVIHNNHLFSVDVFDDQGKPLNVPQLSEQLQECVEHSEVAGIPVGILTAMDRTSWGKVYAGMRKDKTNKASLDNIQHSMFAVCLDGPLTSSEGDPFDIAASIFIHGGGSRAYSGSRWYDKTLQFVFCEDGFAGLCFEHTSAEGPAVIGLCDHALDYIEKNQETWLAAPNIKSPQKLQFNISSNFLEVINLALEEVDSAVDDLMLRGLFFEDFGKNFIKDKKLSPDAFIQMAFQLAYYRMYQQPCATYETGSLRRFQLGRTDAIRSCSTDSLAFTRAMDEPSVPPTEKVDLLRQAIQSHRKYTDETISGQGMDRHLLGLMMIALENGKDVPEIFMDLAFKESTHFRMSTSQVSSKYKSLMCFGPVVPDGYGLCYNSQDDELIVSISSFNNSPETNSDTFSGSLATSLQDMRKLLESGHYS